VRTEARIFNGVALFLFVSAAVYATWTGNVTEGTDWVGSTALVLSGALLLLCGSYFSFVARRISPRPEDRPDAEISDGAGDLGFFSPGSYWPFGLGLAAAVAGFGIVFWAPWLMAIGAFALLAATGGLLFEYYTGSRVEQEPAAPPPHGMND
jgi:hypothetical protein